MSILTIEHVRAAWAEQHAATTGTVKRTDIVDAFGVSAPTASTAIGYLLKHHSGCLEYDHAAREYRWKSGRKPKLKLPEWVKELREDAE